MLWQRILEPPRPRDTQRSMRLIGAAIGAGAHTPGCEQGPETLLRNGVFERLRREHPRLSTVDVIGVPPDVRRDPLARALGFACALATRVRDVSARRERIGVIGGDHSCAIGTWSGVRLAMPRHERLGLLWIDAHMDSHTPETSPSGALHGMPLAVLLGAGPKPLVEIGGIAPKLSASALCLVGVRNFEPAEAELLRAHGVRVFTMDEIRRRGIQAVLKEALERVRSTSERFGVSIDLDAIDPSDAPAVGTPEAGGIAGKDLVAAMRGLADEPRLAGVEIAEFNPTRDADGRTAELIGELIAAVAGGAS